MEIESENTEESENSEGDELTQNGYIRLISNEEENNCNQKRLLGCIVGTAVSLFIFYVVLVTTS
jgi:hypothetical protein